MSVRITTDVFCDGCGNWAHYRVSAQAHVRAAQRAAKAAGWVFDRHGDCKCPACAGKMDRRQYWSSGEHTRQPTLADPPEDQERR